MGRISKALLCPLNELAPGTARGFDPQGSGEDTVFAVNLKGRVYAYQDRCPHDGVTHLPWRRHAYLNHANDRIVCSAHGAEFLIDSGKCVLGPCLGGRLTRVNVHIEGGSVLLET